MAEPFPVIGLIGARWRELGGADGPFGAPLGAEEDVPGHRGRRQGFIGGEIAWSPEADLVTSVYRLRNDAAFMLSVPSHSHRSFHYEISYNGAPLGRSNVLLRSPDPRIDVKLQGFGEFAFVARTCDGDAGDDCTDWAIPVRVVMGEVKEPGLETPKPTGMPPVTGALAERWHELGAWSGHLGKPTTSESVSADGTRSQTFEHGMISTAPLFPSMVIAAYQRGRRLEVTWGGGNRPFNAFRVDVFHNNVKFLEALVNNFFPTAGWARMTIAPGHYSFATGKGNGDYTFVIFPTLAGSTSELNLAPNPDPAVTQDPPSKLDPLSLDFLTFPFGQMSKVSVMSFDWGVGGAELKYPVIGAAPAEAFATQVLRAQDIAKHHVHKERLVEWPAGFATENNTLLLVAYLEASLDDPEYRASGELSCRVLAHALLRSLDRGHGRVGTSYDQGALGSRQGDYDMALKGLMVVAYRYRHLLTAEQIDFMMHLLMPVNIAGRPDPNDLSYMFLTEKLPETENHLLMINSTRYLVNQIMLQRTGEEFYNNATNGTVTWLLKFLHTIAKHDFLEFNSRPYQRLSLHALVNLHEFAKDHEITTAAQLLLDYAFMKFAVSSCRLRRIAPFRRLHENINRTCNEMNDLLRETGNDQLIGFFLAYAGPSDRDGQPAVWFPDSWTMVALIVAPAAYRPPPEAYEVALRPSESVQHRFFHGRRPRMVEAEDDAEGGVEIYYRTPSFVLTAGGMFLNSGYGGDQFTGMAQVAYAQATTLLLTRAQDVDRHPELNLKFEDLIRFEQFPSIKKGGCSFELERYAVNTGIHEGFACGANLEIPAKWLELTGTPATGTPGLEGWYLLDLNRDLRDYGSLGAYVAAYRAPVAGLLELGLELAKLAGSAGGLELVQAIVDNARNIGLLYVVDATTSGMSFTTFEAQVVDRNSFPAVLDWRAPYTFTAPGEHDRKFEFRPITPDLNKYAARVISVDGVPVAANGLSALRLADGPYIRAPGEHDGKVEIRSPRRQDEPDAPLVLDFRDPARPRRVDNRETLPRPWIERAQAIRTLAGLLLSRSFQQTGERKVAEAIISLRNAIRVLQQLDPPAPEQAPNLAMLGLSLHTLALRLIETGRISQAAAPADEAVAVLRRAGTAAGAKVTALARELIDIADQLDIPDLRDRAVAAAQASADLLRPFDPPASEQATHLALLGRALHTLVLRLIETGSISQAAAPADEAVAVLRRAGIAAGANVTALAHELIDIADQLDLPDLRDRAVAAAQAAADLLRHLDPPASEQAIHLALLGRALHTLALRLIEAGRISQATAPADEAVAVFRRAGSAAGAKVLALAQELIDFASQLDLPDLRDQAVAAAEAAADLLRSFDPPPSEQATYLALLGLALHTVALRLIETGRISQAATSADEAISVLRQAATAAGAEVESIRRELMRLAAQLAGAGLNAESTAALQAAQELPQS